MEGWKKTLLYAGGAAGVAAVLYYLLREEEDSTSSPEPAASSDSKKELRVEEVTKEQVQQILSDMVESQEKMKAQVKEITQELMAKPAPLMETYERMKASKQDELLDQLGINPMQFDQLLSKYQQDPQVREGIMKLMGAPDPKTMAKMNGGASVSAKQIVEAHSFMLEELQKVLEEFKVLPSRASLDEKVIIQTAHVIVQARIEKQLGLSSDDMEAAMFMHQQTLAMDQEFNRLSMKMQELMAKFVG